MTFLSLNLYDTHRLVPHMHVLFWGPGDFPISYSNRDTSWIAWNRHSGSFMVYAGILFTYAKQNLVSLPFPFLLKEKETVGISVQFQVRPWCFVHKQSRVWKLPGPDVFCWTWDQRHSREQHFCFLPGFTSVDREGPSASHFPLW